MVSPEAVVRALDRFQQRNAVIAFPFAVVKKFGDDQAGALASLVAYYGFFAVFPLLLVFVTILALVPSGQPGLREDIVSSALGRFPVVGDQIRERANVEALRGNWYTLALSLGASLWAGLGVAQAAQKAMNVAWDIPRSEWPSFVQRRLRSLLMLLILGAIIVASTLLSGLSASGIFASAIAEFAGYVVPLVLNLVLFALAYQVLTARNLRWRDVIPGALVAGFCWTVLQRFGGYYVTHEISQASDVYGAFALVIGVVVWIGLGAQLMVLCAEVNVVSNRRLWPRSLVQPPLNDGDREVYRTIAHRGRMRPELSLSRTWTTFPISSPYTTTGWPLASAGAFPSSCRVTSTRRGSEGSTDRVPARGEHRGCWSKHVRPGRSGTAVGDGPVSRPSRWHEVDCL